MGLRYLFHFCSAEGGQKDCTLEIFLPGYGKKRQKNRILQTNFESKRVDLPKEFDFSFFHKLHFSCFVTCFEGFGKKKKTLYFSTKFFKTLWNFKLFDNLKKMMFWLKTKMKYHDSSKMGYRRWKWKRCVFSYNLEKIS